MSTAQSPRRDAAPVCVWRCLDRFPDLAHLHARHPERYPHLLESASRGASQARFDILFAFPGDTLTLDHSGQLHHDDTPVIGDFLETFDAHWRRLARDVSSTTPFPFHGGWFVYLGYELARHIEPTLAGLPTNPGWPIAQAVRFPAAVIRDHARRQTWLVSEIERAELLAQMEQDLRGVDESGSPAASLPTMEQIIEESEQLYLERVDRVRQYIWAGDTFQANLSRSWRGRFRTPPTPASLYMRLRAANPAPYAGLMTLGGNRTVVSSSPERLVRTRHGRISTRPIAGTFPRAADAQTDQQQRLALVQHSKERAEHVMLVDLERNDLGRICRPGSVRANELFTVESYPHVHHIVSNVSGELRDDVSPAQVIRAVFPGGTITGCPKLRTMQIIAELEAEPRGAYTGSMGYVNRDGSHDFNILIRTMMLDGQDLNLRAGGGIVADSDPQRELHETRAKAKGMLAALGIAGTAE